MNLDLKTLLIFFLIVCATATDDEEPHCTGRCRVAASRSIMSRVMGIKLKEHDECVKENRCPTIAEPLGATKCVNGWAGKFQCKNIDLQSFVPLRDMGSRADGNDIWGWTDPITKAEIAIFGAMDGTSFVDISNPYQPVVLGFLPSHRRSKSIWRDMKVYKDHVFIVSEARYHGMQVFDLRSLRREPELLNSSAERRDAFEYVNGVKQLEPHARYSEHGSAHNIAINEESGYAYSVGTKTCNGGLHIIDIREPLKPKFAGCANRDGYVHDAQIVNYIGPDERYRNKEMAFGFNEDTLTIYDVTDKSSISIVSRRGYSNSKYTHQGWLNSKQTHILMNDELDELKTSNKKTRTLVWNVEKLDNPRLVGSFYSSENAIDHNLYITDDDLVYEANYSAGLRVLKVEDYETADIKEVAFIDICPRNAQAKFEGA